MGTIWSEDAEPDMRIASRDVCDDETWTNTILNRSTCSVQDWLDMLDGECCEDEFNLDRRRSIEFGDDHVRVFHVEPDDDIESEEEDLELELQIELTPDENDKQLAKLEAVTKRVVAFIAEMAVW